MASFAKNKFLKNIKPAPNKPGSVPAIPGQASMQPVKTPTSFVQKAAPAIAAIPGVAPIATAAGAAAYGAKVLGSEMNLAKQRTGMSNLANQQSAMNNKAAGIAPNKTTPRPSSPGIQSPGVSSDFSMAPSSFTPTATPGEASMQPYFGDPTKKKLGINTPERVNQFIAETEAKKNELSGGAAFPATNTRLSDAEARLAEARKAFLSASAPGQEAQDLQNQLADYQTATAQAVAGEEGLGRGRTVSLVRGRQALLQEQRQLGEQNLAARAAIAQRAQEQNANVALQMLGFAKEDLDRAEKLAAEQGGEIKEFGGQLLRIAPDGSVSVLATATPDNKPITVSAGQTVIDPVTGDILFQAGDKPEPLPDNIQEYLFSLDNPGFKTGGAQKPPSQEASRAMFLGSVATNAIDQIANQLETSGGGLFGSRALVTSPQYRALENQLTTFLGFLTSGANVPEAEIGRLKSLLPSVFKSDEAAKRDLKTLRTAISGYVNTLGGNQAAQGGATQAPAQASANVDELRKMYEEGLIDEQEYLESIQSYGSFSNDLGTSVNGLGRLSEKYESGGNPGAIGYDSTGGYSYGTYQLAHSNAKKFIENSPYSQYFQGIPFNSDAWRARWKQVAQQDPQRFAQAQKDYIKQTHFDPQVQKLASAGINAQALNPVVLDAIWSTAVQHGPNNNIVVNALKKAGSDPANQLKAIYAARWGGGQNFRSSTKQVQNSVYNRFFGQNGELNTALSQLYGNVA